jgi:hypothetical protein
LPDSFAATRDALHRVAEEIVAPARKPDNEIALRRTPGGFGTPPFDLDGTETQIRVEGVELVVSRGGEDERIALGSLAEAGAALGAELLPGGPPADASALELDPEAAARLADFYEFSDGALREALESFSPEASPSEINLWPEHFDLAFEAGSEEAGSRANYGASPGDENHPEPYLYVGPWSEVEGELWDATAFTGAELSYRELASAPDPAAAAREFFTSRREALGA